MECPLCKNLGSDVKDSRPCLGLIRRRRQCQVCKHLFSTREYVTDESPEEIEIRVTKDVINKIRKFVTGAVTEEDNHA